MILKYGYAHKQKRKFSFYSTMIQEKIKEITKKTEQILNKVKKLKHKTKKLGNYFLNL